MHTSSICTPGVDVHVWTYDHGSSTRVRAGSKHTKQKPCGYLSIDHSRACATHDLYRNSLGYLNKLVESGDLDELGGFEMEWQHEEAGSPRRALLQEGTASVLPPLITPNTTGKTTS
jgi:hypothetical protein